MSLSVDFVCKGFEDIFIDSLIFTKENNLFVCYYDFYPNTKLFYTNKETISEIEQLVQDYFSYDRSFNDYKIDLFDYIFDNPEINVINGEVFYNFITGEFFSYDKFIKDYEN